MLTLWMPLTPWRPKLSRKFPEFFLPDFLSYSRFGFCSFPTSPFTVEATYQWPSLFILLSIVTQVCNLLPLLPLCGCVVLGFLNLAVPQFSSLKKGIRRLTISHICMNQWHLNVRSLPQFFVHGMCSANDRHNYICHHHQYCG